MEEKIRERIEKLKTEKEAFIKEADFRLVAYSTAIAELEKLLEPNQEEKPKE